MLQDCPLHFEIFQEYAAGSRGEQIMLGKIKLNLAEYCDAHDGSTEDGLSRRYLMQDSKINSTLRVCSYKTVVNAADFKLRLELL